MSLKISLRFFNDREFRVVGNEAGKQWWFAVMDIDAALSESSSPQNYWYVLKNVSRRQKRNLLQNVRWQINYHLWETSVY